MIDIKLFNKYNILSFLFYFFPFALALGNSAVNINILFIILLGSILFKSKLIKIETNSINISLLIFFFVIIISSFLNYFDLEKYSFIDPESKNNFFKSLVFFRFFLVFIILVELIKLDKFNITNFYISASIVSFFLCIDLFYQSYFLIDLFGYVVNPESHRLSGFFGNEYIAGGYLQKFSLFLIFSFTFLKISKNYFKIFYFFFFLLICFIAILLTNNRMPLILFCLSFFFLSLFFTKLKKLSILGAVIILITGSLFLKFNDRTQNFFKNYLFQINQISKIIIDQKNLTKNQVELTSDYARLFNSSLDLLNKNKLYGLGIKSFRKNCFQNLEINNFNKSCNNHPHNYYFEILISTGYLGFIVFLNIIFISIINYYKNYKQDNYYNLNSKFIIIIPLILFLIEIFPIRSSGGFFTTSNSIYFFIILAIINYFKINRIK